MPPDISAGLSSTAGLIAPAAAPPVVGAGPTLPDPLSASLFAVFLAQSTPPSPLAALSRKALGIETKPPLPISLKTALATNLKTMDTLPTLSFPLALSLTAPKAKDKASELLLSPAPMPAHHAPADAPVNIPTPLPPSQSAPNQAVFMPSLLNAALPSLMPPGVHPPLPVVSNTVAPVVSGAVPPSPALPVPALPVPTALPTALVPPAAAAPSAPARLRADTPVLAIGLLRPRTFAPALAPTLSQPSPVLSQIVPTLPQDPAVVQQDPALIQLTAPLPAAPVVGQPAVIPTDALPHLASPVQDALPQPVQVQAVLQTQAVPVLPPPPAADFAVPVTVTAVAQGMAVPIAAPLPERPQSAPAKTAGKISPAALKSAAENADTSTRILQGQKGVVSAKTAPSALTLPLLEKHAPEHQSPAVTDDAGKNSALFAPPATVTDAAKADVKPLSARERAEVVKQTTEGMKAMPLPTKPGAAEQMSLHLHPKEWGRLEVSVSVVPSAEAGAAKTVTAHIVAETPQVKAALQSGTGALHQALKASGLHLEHLTVSVKLPESSVPDVKPAVQNAPTGPGSNANPGTHSSPGSGFGTGQWQNNRQPPVYAMPVLNEPEIEDAPLAKPALRALFGRVDTHA